MILPAWHEEPIAKNQQRASFDCGEPALNLFLQRYAPESREGSYKDLRGDQQR